MYSELIKSKLESPNCSSRDGEKITKITIHHAAGVLGGTALASIFMNPKRQASANYCIGKDGEIIGCVPEEKRAWTSGSKWNDSRAITIEVSNCSGKPNWEISETVMQSLILLCADICRRYCIVPEFTGDKNGSLTFHYMYQATECPGPYIKSHIKEIIVRINNELCIEQKPIPKPEEPAKPKDNSFKVKVTANVLNVRANPGTASKIVGQITDHGVYTIVAVDGKWGKLKSGMGWIALRYTKEVK